MKDFERFDNVVEAIGSREMLDAMFKWLSADTLNEMLDDFERLYELKENEENEN